MAARTRPARSPASTTRTSVATRTRQGSWYWLQSVRGGRRLSEVAAALRDARASSCEIFGDLTNEEFVETVYLNVLGRRADSSGKAYWVGRLDDGSLGRGRLMIDFSESSENRTRLRIPTNVVLMYGLMVGASRRATRSGRR